MFKLPSVHVADAIHAITLHANSMAKSSPWRPVRTTKYTWSKGHFAELWKRTVTWFVDLDQWSVPSAWIGTVIGRVIFSAIFTNDYHLTTISIRKKHGDDDDDENNNNVDNPSSSWYNNNDTTNDDDNDDDNGNNDDDNDDDDDASGLDP